MTPPSPEAGRAHSAAAERNKAAILAVLLRVLPPHGTALEIAAGTGQHAVHFAAGLPHWTWQPSDSDPHALASIAAWAAGAGLSNLRAPVFLDVTAPRWPVDNVDAIFCANMLHIAPWAACVGLMQGAGRHLAPHGSLVTYGPYIIDGEPLAPSNAAFDADLRDRNPDWGLRRLADVAAAGLDAGLSLVERVPMPANNQTLVFKRIAGTER